MSYARFASSLQRLQPITRRPNPQVSIGLHSRGGSEIRKVTLPLVWKSGLSLDGHFELNALVRNYKRSAIDRGVTRSSGMQKGQPRFGENLSHGASTLTKKNQSRSKLLKSLLE